MTQDFAVPDDHRYRSCNDQLAKALASRQLERFGLALNERQRISSTR